MFRHILYFRLIDVRHYPSNTSLIKPEKQIYNIFFNIKIEKYSFPRLPKARYRIRVHV